MATTEPTTKGGRRLFSQVSDACEGLNYVSETDAPVEPFFTPAGTGLTAEIAKDLPDGRRKMEETSFDEFFSKLTEHKPWHTPEQRRNADRFARLRKLLETELRDLHVYRAGRVRIDVFIVGTDKEGNVLGIKTKAVET